ncbi:acyl-CoA dehydrogenase family protein [Streptomyces sp. S3(2020)]|uniref:acyl-CoA dehydrogenase family protein n=1 Tax=Streptomyces sp. S3(2020) TaxID=2732044 RepID=UPI0014893BE8|nr:acyl-CoA dehydrogenase family protein [Streptomyces sp. S3(2020)]NNN31056.1 acyl-CoA dehydrogenase family protein [Streptomyces sp. S3(2020)]
MIELDDRTRAFQRQARAWAQELKPLALELDQDPDAIHRHLDVAIVSYLTRMTVPPEFNPDPVVIDGHRFYGTGTLERVVFAEEAAVGDAGMLLASPGPVMSGVLVDAMGDERQKKWFYSRVMEKPTWTFFALTEPDRGSDAAAMDTTLTPDGDHFVLRGAKRYIGNAARADLGIVFARTRPGPLGVTAVLIDTSAAGFTAEPLETIGLRGLRLTAVTLDDVRVPAEQVLGRHLRATQRGMWSAVQGLNRLRPGVAAFGLGIARAAYEYVLDNRRTPNTSERHRLDRLGLRLTELRQLIWRAAIAVDDNEPAAGYLASAAKARASRLAEEATLEALGHFGPGARLDHPLLDKLARDARGVEFMEGTGNIQKLNLFTGLVQGGLRRD